MNKFNNTELRNNNNMTEKIHYLGELRLIGRVMQWFGPSKKVMGYVIMLEKTRKFKMYTVDQTKELLRKFKFVNAELNDKDDIINTECSMDKLLVFNTNMHVVDHFGVTILGEIMNNGGYRIMNTQGEILDVTEDELLNISDRMNLLNAKVVNKGGTRIISGIKKEFTKIEKIRKEVKPTNPWIKNKHVEKLINYTLPKIVRVGLTKKDKYGDLFINSASYSRAKDNSRYFDFNRETKIIIKEVYTPQNKFNLTDEEKNLLKRIVKELPHSDISGKINSTDTNKNVTYQDELYLFALAQFVVANKSIATNCIPKYSIQYKYMDELRNKGLLSQRFESFVAAVNKNNHEKAKKAEEEAKLKNKEKYKKFNTRTFKSGKDIAQIGFAVIKDNKGYKFSTDDGHTRTLRYLGDYIGENYEKYKQNARCLGDLAAIANIEKIIQKYYGNTRYGVSREDLSTCLEVIIAISYLYNSVSVRDYISDNYDMITEIIGEIPDFESISNTDYKLSKELSIYFASGFNVFYNDLKYLPGYYADLNPYTNKYISESEIINYRQMSLQHNIQHPLLQNELASIVNMVTSDECNAKSIEMNIGKLRFI